MRLLVTGGTGSLGRDFVTRAAAAGLDVRVLTRRAPDPRSPTPVPHAIGDPVSGDGLDAAVAGVDVAVHLASDRRRATAVDVDGTLHLLAASIRANVGHLIYISIVGVDVIPYSYYQRKG